jgi:type I restriction enzyme S subunit
MNTDAAVPGLNRNNVYRLVTIKPVSSLITNFSKMVILFRKEIASNQKEIQSLEAVRDSLLPKLLSGELEIQSND